MPVGGGDDPEAGEGLLPPAQEAVALLVPLELDRCVFAGRHGGAKGVHYDGVVDDEVHPGLRVDARGVAPHPGQRGAHGRQVHERGNSREVLEDHPGWPEGDFAARGCCRVPSCQRGNVLFADGPSVNAPEQRLEQHPDRERKSGDGAKALPFHRLEGKDVHIPTGGAVFFEGSKGVL